MKILGLTPAAPAQEKVPPVRHLRGWDAASLMRTQPIERCAIPASPC